MGNDDTAPKSAYELAMERLQAADREAGVEQRTLNDDQKERIAEKRRNAKAKLAELEILRDKSIAETMGDPEKLAETNKHYGIDRQRIDSRLEDDVRGIREED